jgi:hypothetical protein
MPPHACTVGPAFIGGAAILCNLPLGYLRQGARKFSATWFLWVHLSIPFIAWLRIREGLSYGWIPLFFACAVAGQLIGGRLRPPPKS